MSASAAAGGAAAAAAGCCRCCCCQLPAAMPLRKQARRHSAAQLHAHVPLSRSHASFLCRSIWDDGTANPEPALDQFTLVRVCARSGSMQQGIQEKHVPATPGLGGALACGASGRAGHSTATGAAAWPGHPPGRGVLHATLRRCSGGASRWC